MKGSPWPHGDPDRVVRDVLAEPAFRSVNPTTSVKPPSTIFEIAWDWFVHRVLQPLFAPLAKALGAAHGVGTVVGVVLVVLSLGALAFVLFRFVLAFVRPVALRGGSAPDGHSLATERSSLQWRALAREAAARGDFAQAIAALFAAALVALDERAVVVFDSARTPGEYRRLVRRARAGAAPPFDELAERFVFAAYARTLPSAQDFAAAERAYAAFEPAVAP